MIMLGNTLYQVVHTEENPANNLKVRIKINQQNPIFGGHFPQMPIMPGVCMLQIVKELLEERYGAKLQLQKTGMVKFLSVINPALVGEVEVSIRFQSQHDGTLCVESLITEGERIFFKLSQAIYA